MKLSDIENRYPAMKNVVQRVREVDGIEELYPPQAEAVEAGFLDGKNVVMSVPTASGKTLVAELAIMNTVLSGGKALYSAPLRALAAEKMEEFKEKYSNIAKIGISTGDFDSSGAELGNYDVILVTNEKLDALMRHNPDWMRDVRLVVLDEVHLLHDTHRGPTLEVVTTRLKTRGVQLLALSATIQNSDEVATWLDAELVESSFRPVQLARGIYIDQEINFKEKGNQQLITGGIDPTIALALDIVEKEAQSLVFVNTRRGAEKQAEETGKKLYEKLDMKHKKELAKLAEQIENVLDTPTKQCKRLAGCVLHGTAFHHAGLHSKQRTMIEKNFKNNLVKVICATPTLAAGVNLPGKRVIIRDYKRYGSFGMEPIPVLEIHQMFGRAGRPKYDTEGEAVLIANTESEFDQLWEHYIEGEPEEITSKLGVEPVLRMHTLGLIAQEPLTKDELLNFFENTFYAHQYADLAKVERFLDTILDQLFSWDFIDHDSKNKFKCTPLGLRIAQLYLDPLTAYDFLKLLIREKVDDYVLLTVLCDAAEMRPLGNVRRAEELEIYGEFEKYGLDEDQIRAFRQAYIFTAWMNELTDDKILEQFNMPPGVFRMKLQVADWLLYACSEIARISEREKLLVKIRPMRTRLKYGVKNELLPLIRIRNIGRVRARKLFANGIKNSEDVRAADPAKLKNLLGERVAKGILEQNK